MKSANFSVLLLFCYTDNDTKTGITEYMLSSVLNTTAEWVLNKPQRIKEKDDINVKATPNL